MSPWRQTLKRNLCEWIAACSRGRVDEDIQKLVGAAQYRYRAFLSYRSADRGRAQRLHRQLEAYRVPRPLVGRIGLHGGIPSRLGIIFRDRDELRTSADIGTTIAKAWGNRRA
jgi:hypothetical protein